MEENENEVVMEGSNENNSKTKKIVIGAVILLVIVLVIVGIVNIVKPSPEKTVKTFIKNLDSKKVSKAFDCIDIIGATAFEECSGDYEDFKDNYDDAKEEWEDEKEDNEEYVEEMIETLQDQLEDYDEFSVEIKEIKKSKKVSGAKNLYKVRAKIKTVVKDDDDTDRDNSQIDFYLYKKSGKYYIVGMDTKSGNGIDIF